MLGCEPAHGTEILAYREREDAVPLSAKPMATLQSTLQRLKEQGEIENTGRNRWRLSAVPAVPPIPLRARARPARRSRPRPRRSGDGCLRVSHVAPGPPKRLTRLTRRRLGEELRLPLSTAANR